MGSYLNPGNKGFQESLNSEIYVDKTGRLKKQMRFLIPARSSCASAAHDGLESRWLRICWLLTMNVEKIQLNCLER